MPLHFMGSENLSGEFYVLNNGFTWIKYFTQVFDKMDKDGIFKIWHGKKVQN